MLSHQWWSCCVSPFVSSHSIWFYLLSWAYLGLVPKKLPGRTCRLCLLSKKNSPCHCVRNHSEAQVRGHYHQDSWCFARRLCLVTKQVANGCHRIYDSSLTATRFAPSMFMIQSILCFKDWLEKVPPSPTTLLHFFLSELPLLHLHLLSLHPAFCRCCCWKSWTRGNLGLLDQKVISRKRYIMCEVLRNQAKYANKRLFTWSWSGSSCCLSLYECHVI